MADDILYSDIDRRFDPNDQGDIKIVEDAEALEQALLNIIETSLSDSERVMRPEFGSDLRDAVFQPLDQITNVDIRNGLQNAFDQDERFTFVGFSAEQIDQFNKLRIKVRWSSPSLIDEQITVVLV